MNFDKGVQKCKNGEITQIFQFLKFKISLSFMTIEKFSFLFNIRY